MPVHPRDLRQVAQVAPAETSKPKLPPPPDCTVAEAIDAGRSVIGARVSHLKRGLGTVTGISESGKEAIVQFDSGQTQNILFPFLELVEASSKVEIEFRTPENDEHAADRPVSNPATESVAGRPN